MIKLKNILFESMELDKFVPPIQKARTFSDFLQSLVGKKLTSLLDAASFARLYIGNKYGIGPTPDENDVQAILSTLLSATTDYINYRQVTPLRAKLDAAEAEDLKRPEVQAWNKKRNELFRQKFAARKNNDDELVNKIEALQAAHERSNPGTYRKNMADMSALVKDFHNRPLTSADVTPSPNDSEEDKARLKRAEEAFSKLKELMG